jgi:hypothetical protein
MGAHEGAVARLDLGPVLWSTSVEGKGYGAFTGNHAFFKYMWINLLVPLQITRKLLLSLHPHLQQVSAYSTSMSGTLLISSDAHIIHAK